MKSFFAKLQVLAFLTILFGNGLYAQIPNGYYNNASGKTGDELKTALHDIIKNHTSISYAYIWTAFWSTDNKGDNVVWDMYSDGADYTYNYYSGGSNQQCGEYEQEGDCYNREHSWPQSWFSGDDQAIPSRDLHHVFPTDGFVNSKRSNYPYGEVSTATWTSQNGSKLGTCKSSLGYTGTVFEPIDEYKGDFARALMYMSVRYYGEDSNWSTSGMTNKSEILPWAIEMLMRWSDEDPVSQKEIDRNNAVYGIQANRNPFIDYPDFARMIWDPNWHGGMGGYVKVTSSNEITDGDYLIVCENSNVAFNGALTSLDDVGNTIEVSIFNNNIESNATTDAAAFTITAKTGGYSIKSARGYYIGNTSNENALKSSTNDNYVNMISITNDGDADIVCSSSYLRYNAASSQTRFRYYKSSSYTNQQAIQLYKKIAVYSITLASVEHGSISADAEEAVERATITLTATPDAGYELDHWTVVDALNNTIPVTNNQFVMPASNVNVSATFVYVGTFTQQYHMVTNASQLIAGRTYLIVNTEYDNALGKTQNNNNRSAASVVIYDKVIETIGDAVCELVLGGQADAWTFKDGDVGYLYAAGSGNYLRTQSTLTNNGIWTISFTDGKASIVSNGDVSQNTIRFNLNNNNPIFSCYASGQKDVCLFIRSEEYDHTESETIAAIFPFDKHTVRSGATLTVAGTATCDDASHLILEEGAQLIHNTDGVMATLKKTIMAWSDGGGWYTIAAPFASLTPNTVNGLTADGLTANDYDLYAYDEDSDNEWLNHKVHHFGLTAGQGYLYANSSSKSLRMAGALNSSTYSQVVNLSYANSDANLKGWNLLGNPTAHEIAISKTEDVADGYYYLNNSDNWVYETSDNVPVGRGFLVKTNATGQSVTLNPQSKGRDHAEPGQYLCIGIGEDKAYVKLNQGVSMPLASLRGQHAPLYLVRDHQPYTMLVRDGAQAVDLCFEPQHSGDYTLTVNLQGLAPDYLHLIDHLTGADVDLLPLCEASFRDSATQPQYTFHASVTDYPSRFRLAFAPTADEPAEGPPPFAYLSHGQIIITGLDGTVGPATLQIIDAQGRVLSSRDAPRRIPTAGMASGVYILRLITADAVKTQKIALP